MGDQSFVIGIVVGASAAGYVAGVTASITAVQRTWYVRTQLRKEEQGAQ